MPKEKPRRGKAAGRVLGNSSSPYSKPVLAQKQPCSASVPTVDLVGLRNRLVGARRRLIERIADDWSDERRFPDTGWSRLLADVHLVIAAVDAVIDDDGGTP